MQTRIDYSVAASESHRVAIDRMQRELDHARGEIATIRRALRAMHADATTGELDRIEVTNPGAAPTNSAGRRRGS